MIVEAGKFKISKVAWQPGAREELILQFKAKGQLLAEFLLPLGRWVFSVPVKSFNWLDEAHLIYEGISALLNSTDLNVNVTPKHPHRNIWNVVWANIWAWWPNQVDIKMVNHIPLCIPIISLGPIFGSEIS